ncbi:helix-turn-helix transcriptional regulator [Phragmitibacter flavus]|nr:LuxR family transcriptional regulator [Phragmitibacter flavus]
MNSATLRSFSSLVLELNDPLLPEERLFDHLIEGIAKLIPLNSFWVTSSDLHAGQVTSYLGPWAQEAVDLVPTFCQHVQDHPQFMALCQGKSARVDSVSDYVSRKAWRATGMFDEVISKIAAEDQMSTSTPLNDRVMFSLVVNRDGWGFGGQERALLALLAPHAIQAWRTRWLLKRIGLQQTGGFNSTLPDLCFQAMIDSFGNVVEAEEGALRWLRETFAAKIFALTPVLPEPLLSWLRSTLAQVQSGGESLASLPLSTQVTSPRGIHLQARLAPGPLYGLHAIAIERMADPVSLGIARLQKLNLSERQAEVLYWLAEGKTNDEIAGILRISLFTVKAHLRTIFNLLMVENRHSAAAMAWQHLQRAAPTWKP